MRPVKLTSLSLNTGTVLDVFSCTRYSPFPKERLKISASGFPIFSFINFRISEGIRCGPETLHTFMLLIKLIISVSSVG